MIAYSHRATQVITPAATIMATNIAVSNLMDYILTEIIVGIVNHSTTDDTIRRVPPLIALIIAFFVIYSPVHKELWSEPSAVIVVEDDRDFGSILNYN